MGDLLHRRLLLSLLFTQRIYVGTKSFWRAARFAGRTLVHWKETTDWLLFLTQHPVLSAAPPYVIRVLGDKIHRPFARCGLDIAGRAAMLVNHYQSIGPYFSDDTLLYLVSGKRLKLTTFSNLKGDRNFIFTLSRDMLSQHQGELTLLFTDETTGIHLARLVANMQTDPDGKRHFVVCGMQGPGAAYKDDIIRITRALSGMRPKRAVMEAACALARYLKADDIVATCKKNHVSQSKKKWRRKVVADYDGFLQELEIGRLPSGDYLLPTDLPRKNPDDVAPKKRKDCLRRHDYLDQIAKGVTETLTHLQGTFQK